MREALTGAASTITDERAVYSNYGDCVDLFAPGDKILSAGTSSTSASTVKSGTSMAAPHVTGGAAALLSRTGALSPADVASRLLAATTPNVIEDAGLGTPNRLLFLDPQAAATSMQVTRPANQSGRVGTPVRLELTATGGAPPYRWTARLGGRGERSTTTVTQTVAIPSGCRTYQLSFWLRIDSAETSRVIRDDTLTASLGSRVLRQYSNVDKNGQYVQGVFDVRGQAGRTVTLSFQATEDGAARPRSRSTTSRSR